MAFKRAIATAILLSMMCSPCLAVIKNVDVWGVRSINSMGDSDYDSSMDDMIEEYAPYLQTDGLTEFFFKEDGEVEEKFDVDEATAWLIDNNVFNRDEKISVVDYPTMPAVSIEKFNIADIYGLDVHRSDALMYIYKSVYGPIEGRTIGVETKSIRVDNGIAVPMQELLDKYMYLVYDSVQGTTIGSAASNGMSGSSGSGYGGGSGGSGGTGGKAETTTRYSIVTSEWRYTPQGDKYTSIFGDTNFFISENHFTQTNTGANGGNGGNGGYATAGSYGTATGGDGGRGGDGGSLSNTINYETDYKSIYLHPGADFLLYTPTDIIESYIQAAISRGVIPDLTVLSDEAASKFYDLSVSSTLPSWSGQVSAHIAHLNRGIKVTTDRVENATLYNTLGKSYVIVDNGISLTINRSNLFRSDTGYFKSEYMTKMDAYQMIYDMVYASEKKLSDLEADIVNYKYGLEFNGIAKDEDIEVIKYLIAKGILNYDGSDELEGLYQKITWDKFLPILYRVANKDARLDFSVIQLTDSEQSWRAKGFYPQSVSFMNVDDSGTTSFEYDQTWLDMQNAEQMDPNEMSVWRNRKLYATTVEGEDVAYMRVVGKISHTVKNSGDLIVNGIYMDFAGAEWATMSNENCLAYFTSLLNEITPMSEADLKKSISEYDSTNAYHELCSTILYNVYAISRMQTDSQLVTDMEKVLADWYTKPSGTMSSRMKQLMFTQSAIKNAIVSAKSGIAVKNIQYSFSNGSAPLRTIFALTVEQVASTLSNIQFDIQAEHGTANYKTYTCEFSGNNYDALMAGTAVYQMNGSTVTVSTNVTEAEAAAVGGPAAAETAFNSTVDTKASASTGPAVQYTSLSGTDAFISWKDIVNAYPKDWDGELVKISDTILLNTETDTYAYFSPQTDDSRAVALVGTHIITGDADLGVMFKSGEGESATVYYHIEAIKALMNAAEEYTILSGTRAINLPSQAERNAAKAVPLYSNGGVTESDVVAMQILLSTIDDVISPQLAPESLYNQSYKAGNTRWGLYLNAYQSNRATNMVTRVFNYQIPNGQANAGSIASAFVVVQFKGADMNELGLPPLQTSSSLQDLLDSPAQQPVSVEGKQAWNRNKSLCNAFANWIYGTSGVTYVETGYLTPSVRMYTLGSLANCVPPDTLFGSLTVEQRDMIEFISTSQKVDGAVITPLKTPTAGDYHNDNVTDYYMAEDCSAAIVGGTIYLHYLLFDGLAKLGVNDSLNFKMRNQNWSPSEFRVGMTFTPGTGEFDDVRGLVTKIENGRVTCQIGPISGLPFLKNGEITMLENSSSTSLPSLDYSTSLIGGSRIDEAYRAMFSMYRGIKYAGITEEPTISYTNASGRSPFVVSGQRLKVFDNSTRQFLGDLAIPSMHDCTSYGNIRSKMQSAVSGVTTMSFANAQCYFNVEFDVGAFVLTNSRLVESHSVAEAYINPAALTSINDLIIDKMITQATGAIEVNQVPPDALLRIGNTYFKPVGPAGENRTYVGYAEVPNDISFVTLVDCAGSFANTFVRAGNQYVNISHYFEKASLMFSQNEEQRNALLQVVNDTMCFDQSAKYAFNTSASSRVSLFEGDGTSAKASYYAPLELKLNRHLLAYENNALKNGEESTVKTYTICNFADNLVSGAFEELPFYTDDALGSADASYSMEVSSSSYQQNSLAGRVIEAFLEEQDKLFGQSFYVLLCHFARVVLCWLLLSSWMAYSLQTANLKHILEDVKNPSQRSGNKGVDLLKIISLGTIDLDTEFTLGKFLQYDGVLVILFAILTLMLKQ